jgi:uncharacterized repeat protein (TIGR03803 family)
MKTFRILATVVFAALLSRYCEATTTTNKPTQLFSFSGGADGGIPEAGLVEGSDGIFYGTTSRGGASNTGTVFKISSAGTLTTLYSFTAGADGATPEAELVQGTDGLFYGTALFGGSNNNGTVFQISSNGVFTALHSFTGTDGATPEAALVEGSDGNFYGTTSRGGASDTGTVFQITSAGTLTTLYSFTGSTNGATPKAGLVQGSDGFLYGTTYLGGTNNDGTVFQISSNGVLTTIYQFDDARKIDGKNPEAALVQGRDGNFYGTTYLGGVNNDGTAFVINSAGTLTTIHHFGGGTEGSNPRAAFIQGTDGRFYAMATAGGYRYGNVFQMLSNGVTTTVYNFFGSLDGGVPVARLVEGSDGYFYGTAGFGGPNLHGVVFRISAFPGGTYNGLAIQTNAPSAPSSGFLNLVLTVSGSFQAKLTMGGLRSTFRGQFDVPGNATNAVPRKTGNPLQVIMHLNEAGGSNEITGTVSNNLFTSQLLADPTYSLTNHYPLAGRYTFTLAPANTNDTTVPQGFGYGTLTVSKTGSGRLSGVLGDGTKIKANVPVSSFDTFPFYNAIYNQKQGSCVGWLTITTNAASTNATLDAAVDWIKLPAAKDRFYPAGFATTVTLTGASFVKPSKGGPTVAGNAHVILGGGNTLSNIVKSVVISSNGFVTVTSPDTDQLALFIVPTTGQFLGSFFNTAINKRAALNGLMVQTNNSTSGGGLFLGTNQTGFVILAP